MSGKWRNQPRHPLKSVCRLLIAFIALSADASAECPNILLILSDDLGWSDIGVAGNMWHDTPNIDQLAESGMRFTDAYAPAPICSASRASLLTGKTTARLGFEFVTKNEPGYQKIDTPTPLKAPPFTLSLPLSEHTIAERLIELNYTTAFFGKWHLNAHHRRYLGWSPTHGPKAQGFQVAVEDFGAHPYSWKKQKPATTNRQGEFPRDSMVDGVCDFLRKKRSQPYFVMASSFYVHTPVKTPCAWLVKKYEKRIPAEVPNRQRRVTYAAFVETLDYHVGRILAALDESGQRNQTLVVFTSDNGGHPEYAANAPLRGSKWNLYEGGIRVPLIVRWPGKIKAKTLCTQPVIGYDLLPTLVDVAGGHSKNVDGISIASLFSQPNRETERNLVWHFPYYHPETGFGKAQEGIGINDFAVSKTRPQSAIRRGDFKLIHFHEDDRFELYNVKEDISEQRELSHQQPQTAARLKEQLIEELLRMNARRATRNGSEATTD